MIRTDKLTMRFGGLVALDKVSLEVRPDELFSIIGPNGSGKSTLFNVITGIYTPTGGEVYLQNHPVTGFSSTKLSHLGIARTFQNPHLFESMTVFENVLISSLVRSKVSLLAEIFVAKKAHLLFQNAEPLAHRALKLVDLDHKAQVPATMLSYGDQKRLEIARGLAAEPKVLLLDEPVAGLNPDERTAIKELIVDLHKKGLPIMLIEHDMHMVMGISDRVMVLDYGRCIAMGPPQEVAKDPKVITAYLGVEEDAVL